MSKKNNHKAIVFDMDECIGCFWSLWPLYDLYNRDEINDISNLIKLAQKTILPTCLRPNLYYLLQFLSILKEKQKVKNIFLYTNNGNYLTVKNKKENKITFPHFIIKCIETHFNLPGLFDLVIETIFIRKKDARNNIKKKKIEDLEIHGYENPQNILIFDDNKSVWITGSERVCHVSAFKGTSHSYKDIEGLCTILYKQFKNIFKNKLDSKRYLEYFIENEPPEPYTNLEDNEITKLFFPYILKFCL